MSDKRRFEEIIGEIRELLDEALDLVPEGYSRSRAASYWYAHMIVNVTDDHDYMGGCMVGMQDTLEDFDEIDEEEEEESTGDFVPLLHMTQSDLEENQLYEED
tara:strand:- start:1769 stop:2077 length:309 start_codon:yes stop_codon:yes gene_type:complete